MSYGRHRHLLSGWRFFTLMVVIFLTMAGYLLFTIWGGWSDVSGAFFRIGPGYISIALLLSIIGYFLRFSRWQYYLCLLGTHVPWWSSFRIYLSGFSMTPTPGKAGEMIRGLFLADFGVAYRTSIGVYLAERFSDMMAVMLLSMIAMWTFSWARPVVFAMAALSVFVIFAAQNDQLLRRIERLCDRYLPERFSRGIDAFIETMVSFQACYKPAALGMGTMLGVLAWGGEGTAFYFFTTALGYQVNYFFMVSIYAFALLLGGLTFLPGGVGGVEVILVKMLMYQGVQLPDAVAITVLIRTCTLWFSVLVGLSALPFKRLAVR